MNRAPDLRQAQRAAPGAPPSGREAAGLATFAHRHAGHCESGVASGLFTHYGLPLSEPMAFGLSAAMTFVHFPFIKVGGITLTAYRMPPGYILKGVRKRLGAKMVTRKFRSAEAGREGLDALLAEGRPVGMQTSVFWLPYFPKDMRFHFNAHNLIVYGREGGEYLVSDPVFEHPQRCAVEDLQRARFAKGRFAPKGLLYYPEIAQRRVDIGKAIRASVLKTARGMLYAPIPWVGVRAIRGMAKTVANLERKFRDPHAGRMFLGSIIRMQEEIGTGGGGFRFIYASFLQEAAARLGHDGLARASEQMTAVGDQWRTFAALGASYCKGRADARLGPVSDALLECAAMEDRVHRTLKDLSWGNAPAYLGE